MNLPESIHLQPETDTKLHKLCIHTLICQNHINMDHNASLRSPDNPLFECNKRIKPHREVAVYSCNSLSVPLTHLLNVVNRPLPTEQNVNEPLYKIERYKNINKSKMSHRFL